MRPDCTAKIIPRKEKRLCKTLTILTIKFGNLVGSAEAWKVGYCFNQSSSLPAFPTVTDFEIQNSLGSAAFAVKLSLPPLSH
jgi:hypothetical protein